MSAITATRHPARMADAAYYRPEPVRQRMMPKPGKPGKFHPLGIPTLTDRLVQMALKLILEPISSFSARPHYTTVIWWEVENQLE
ncbi:hypothetical protein [Mesorhizobium sp. BHbdii]